jgi:hypothetical protein
MTSDTPPITILIVSHDKPQLLPEAVGSVVGQCFSAWQAVLIDSGKLYDQGFFKQFAWSGDPRLQVVRSTETPALRRRKAMAPWCFNECFRHGLVRGELVMYLCDDDLLYPHAFATFVDAFRAHPYAMVMYASEDIGWLGPDGRGQVTGERRALAPGGKSCNGRIMDCQVDYLQLCHRRAALRALPNKEYWPESKATEDHADGLFMEKLGAYFEIVPIDVKVGQNRRTPWSLNVTAAGTACAHTNHDAPVHETIMDAWTRIRSRLDRNASVPDLALRKEVADFQNQLRQLCEQDHAQRRRLVSRRYRFADRFHAVLARVLTSIGL